MNLIELKVKAQELINDSSLHEKGWTFILGTNLRRLGYLGMCTYTTKVIEISITFGFMAPWEVVRQTVLHEIAHAIAYEHYGETGHGKKWRLICKSFQIPAVAIEKNMVIYRVLTKKNFKAAKASLSTIISDHLAAHKAK